MKQILLIPFYLIVLVVYCAVGISSTNASTKLDPTIASMKGYTTWVVTNKVGEVRSDPSNNAPILLKAPKQSYFPLLHHSGKWSQILLGNNETGWIADGSVQKKTTSNQLQTVSIKANTKVYTGPDKTFQSKESTRSDTPYIPLEVGGQWVHIRSVNSGQSNWVPADSVTWNTKNRNLLPTSVAVIPASTPQKTLPLKGKTIVVDPGHGGVDTGAIGTAKPINERDINLAVANVLVDKLKAAGAQVILTRSTNKEYVSLPDRVKISNEKHADMFISIHQNQFQKDPSVNGTITYYYNAAKSKALARNIESQAISSLHGKDGGNQINQEELYVLDHNTRPAVLVEGCFLSNVKELKNSLLPVFHENLSSGIYHGILQYLGKYPGETDKKKL